jgi:lipopolysaccharide/colanic/teichoic acid biosynthesis glycosyltransferase
MGFLVLVLLKIVAMYQRFGKRIFDVILAILGILLLGPLSIFLGCCIFLTSSENPLFLQLRPGREGRIFKIIKFKTMHDARESNGDLLPDEKRLTKMGVFMRKTSLDEIPQLINVLFGEMSLVGPRPLLPEYLPLYSEAQNMRHSVKPGITGWAQVSGRNTISWDTKFELDIWYVSRVSFLLDLRILFSTIYKVFTGAGINTEGQATTIPFKGAIASSIDRKNTSETQSANFDSKK